MSFDFGRYAASISLAAALIVGCGGSQPPINAPGAMLQTHALAARGDSWNYKVLFRFKGPDGASPDASLVDVHGTLYGTTAKGGSALAGTVFKIATSGSEKTLYSFKQIPDGAIPETSLIDGKGTLYGTTLNGGSSDCGCGTVYSVSASGAEKVLHAFTGPDDGEFPVGVINVHGELYGTTLGEKGALCADGSENLCGTVFKLTPSGHEKILHTFGGPTNFDGLNPGAGLIDVNGTFYGTTIEGGEYSGSQSQCDSENCGTVFSITSNGKEKVLHSFGNGSDGVYPEAALVNAEGTLYGTTAEGGAYGYGTVFSITTSGKEKVIYSFAGGSDGDDPEASLIDVGGTLYGTTPYPYFGTVYSISPTGVKTVLHSFTGGPDGANPRAALLDVAGVLYGTTPWGGRHDHKCRHPFGCGTVFSLSQ